MGAAMSSLLTFMGEVDKVTEPGCEDEFLAAMGECRSKVIEGRGADKPAKRVLDTEACARATAALRECFSRYGPCFEQEYIARMERLAGMDLKPSPEPEWEKAEEQDTSGTSRS